MIRIGLLTCFFFFVFVAYSQVPDQHLRFVDSIENVINSSIKKFVVKEDTGRLVIAGSKNQATSFKKHYYIDSRTSSLHMVTYLRMIDSSSLINDTYYYLNNKPLSAYRLKRVNRKTIPEAAYYFYKDQVYLITDSNTFKSNNEMWNNAQSFIKQYKKVK